MRKHSFHWIKHSKILIEGGITYRVIKHIPEILLSITSVRLIITIIYTQTFHKNNHNMLIQISNMAEICSVTRTWAVDCGPHYQHFYEGMYFWVSCIGYIEIIVGLMSGHFSHSFDFEWFKL